MEWRKALYEPMGEIAELLIHIGRPEYRRGAPARHGQRRCEVSRGTPPHGLSPQRGACAEPAYKISRRFRTLTAFAQAVAAQQEDLGVLYQPVRDARGDGRIKEDVAPALASVLTNVALQRIPRVFHLSFAPRNLPIRCHRVSLATGLQHSTREWLDVIRLRRRADEEGRAFFYTGDFSGKTLPRRLLQFRAYPLLQKGLDSMSGFGACEAGEGRHLACPDFPPPAARLGGDVP